MQSGIFILCTTFRLCIRLYFEMHDESPLSNVMRQKKAIQTNVMCENCQNKNEIYRKKFVLNHLFKFSGQEYTFKKNNYKPVKLIKKRIKNKSKLQDYVHVSALCFLQRRAMCLIARNACHFLR